MSLYVERAWIDKCWLIDAGYDAWFALRDCKHIFVTNCYVSGSQDDGLNPGGLDEGTGTSDVLLQGNYIEGSVSAGIHISVSSTRVSAVGNIIIDCLHGIDIIVSSHHLIADNIIRNCGWGIRTINGPCPYLKILDNLIDTTTVGHGIYVVHDPNYSEIRGNTILSVDTGQDAIYVGLINHSSIVGNIIKVAERGIYVASGSNCIISNNIIEEVVNMGISEAGGGDAVNYLVSDNLVKNIATLDGININSTQSLIVNNVVRNATRYSIRDAGGAGNNRIINNDVDGTISAHATTAIIHLDSSRNFGIGLTAFGTAFAGGLGIGAGVAPTSSPADMAHIWIEDIAGTAGHAGLHTRPECVPAGAGKHIVPTVLIKADTGDPAYSHEGMICINTFDNTAKIYAEGVWRAITAGW